MRLIKAHVQTYRSIIDSGEFEIEPSKTILVGPNEAGKTVLLQALQQLSPPKEISGFVPLRDYPRSLHNEDIDSGRVDPGDVLVVEGEFSLEQEDKDAIDPAFHSCTYVVHRYLDNSATRELIGGPELPTLGNIRSDLLRLAKHADKGYSVEGEDESKTPSTTLTELMAHWHDGTRIGLKQAESLGRWLDSVTPHVDEDESKEVHRLEKLVETTSIAKKRDDALNTLDEHTPVFVLFNNYFRVRPTLHLGNFAKRLASGGYDERFYDYGNECLLKLLGFTAKQLSELANTPEPPHNDLAAFEAYRNNLDARSYKLNAASIRLTNVIREIWNPDSKKAEADRVIIKADGQYLKVVVEDELGVEVELDQRSEGFQWLVSFFVVFFAEARDKHKNAILLLDEPGLSLHGLKQREFRGTVSKLSEQNQVIYTTHSPFLVGPDELDIVRVVEMTDRSVGTKIHTNVVASDPAAMLPLQEALGYDLAQSLFAQSRNLVLEGLTDYWYVEAISELLEASGGTKLNEKIALVPAQSAGKVVYFATILHAHKLKVAALLDSDASGDLAAKQEVLVHKLKNKNILRTKDYYVGSVKKPEIEDLLRETLVAVAKDELGWDVVAKASANAAQPILGVFENDISSFSKYKLAKAFLRWTRSHETSDLASHEVIQWTRLIEAINAALK